MKATAKTAFIHAFIIALFTAATAWAADTPKPDPKDPDKKDLQMEQARDAIAKQDWVGAQALLREAVKRDPQNADAHNLYAYSIRKGPNPAMDLVFRHYNEALRINPRHLGAHEYIGEAYLMSGNVPKAREHLALLEKLCGADCREYQLLKVAVAAQEQRHAQK
jgi:cytochrome c-type biogenesis protein CcmH/NrfG